MVEIHKCNKCGIEIEGKTTAKTNFMRRTLAGEKEVPHKPWRVTLENPIFIGARFELCESCKMELLRSLIIKAEKYDC